MIFYPLFLLYTRVSTWALPSSLQRIIYGYSPYTGPQANPLRFDKEVDCACFIKKLRHSHAIAYNYGLDENNAGGRDLVICLLSDDAAGPRSTIQEIYIMAPSIGVPEPRQEAFMELIEMLPSLKTISFDGNSRLNKVYAWIYEDTRRGNQQWKAVRSSRGYRYSLRGDRDLFEECSSEAIDYRGGYGTDIDRIYRAMTLCDNIRFLSISMSQGGCVIGSRINSFDWKPGDNFSTLLELKLSGYGWIDESVLPPTHARPVSTIAWMESMDWSRLRRLDIDRPPREFLEVYQGKLTSLESLKIRPKNGFWGDEMTFCSFDQNATELRRNYTDFITTLPPLRELSIGGMGELLNISDILQVHGPSLENLTVHEFECDCTPCGNTTWGRPTLSINELRSINELAPDLKYLEIDVYRRRDWPHRVFEELSLFQNLTSLSLWFDLENPYEQIKSKHCYWQEDFCLINVAMEPRLDKEAALKIFKALKAGQKSQKLQKLTLYTGDLYRQRGGGMRASRRWETDNSPTEFTCGVLFGEEDCLRPYTWDDDFANLDILDY